MTVTWSGKVRFGCPGVGDCCEGVLLSSDIAVNFETPQVCTEGMNRTAYS